MTFEQAIGSFLAILVSMIGYYVKQLVSEHRQTRETVIALNTNFNALTQQFTTLYTKHEATDKKLGELLERLVRLEERSHSQTPQTPTRRKAVA
ncbi:MAG: hypothetical protein IPH49_15780 [Ignavibacteria bacterium]|nr:hypothetical protein [Ignavibacteria bacterium]